MFKIRIQRASRRFTDVISYIVLTLCDSSPTGTVTKPRHWSAHQTCFPVSSCRLSEKIAIVTQITGECPQLGTPKSSFPSSSSRRPSALVNMSQ